MYPLLKRLIIVGTMLLAVSPAWANRLFTSGFEVQVGTAEFVAATGTNLFTARAARSGAVGLDINSMVGGARRGVTISYGSADAAGPFFVRFYIKASVAPQYNTGVCTIASGSTGMTATTLVYIGIDENFTLGLYNNSSVLQGSTSGAINDGAWHLVQLMYQGGTGTGAITLKVDGTDLYAGTGLTTTNSMTVRVGGNMWGEGQALGTWYIDDWAVNDSAGSYETSYPVDAKVVTLFPNAAGASNLWTKTDGTTAGDANNYTLVNEVPSEVTTYITKARTGTNIIDDYNVTDSATAGIGSGDTIKVIQVGGAIGSTSTTATGRTFFWRLKDTAGTAAESASCGANVNGWTVYRVAAPKIHQITSYINPATSAAWTPANLDSIQVGVRNNADSANLIRVANVWATVEYVPYVAPPASGAGRQNIIIVE